MKGTVIAEVTVTNSITPDWPRIIEKKKLLITNNLQQQILGYHVKFNVCLVSKPLIHVVLSNFCKLREKHLLLQII